MTFLFPACRMPYWFLLVFFINGCASDIHRIPVGFNPAADASSKIIVLSMNLDVTPSSGYKRTLMYGSKWKYVGNVPQGSVYEIQDDIFMLEAKHMHQAHLVLSSGNRLVGFFLPVEQAFVPLTDAVLLPINNK